MRAALAPALLAAGLLLSPARAAAPTNQECLDCHSDVDPKAWAASVHSAFSCTDCHADVSAVPHDPAPVKPECGTCHSDAVDAWKRSIHARGLAENQKTAQCADCHGGPHAMLAASNPTSPLHRSKIADTCSTCHGVKFVMEPSGIGDRPVFSYRESVHGKAVAAGSLKAAVCTDCHRAHDVLTPLEADSPIFKANTPRTCGTCHAVEEKQYAASVHGVAVARGQLAAPVCTDCHGIHGIKARIDPNSTVSAQNVARFKQRMVEFLALAAGGPSQYSGRDMKEVHEGMRITNNEFDAMVGDIKTSMDKLGIKPREKRELLAIVETTRKQIVEK